MNPRPGPLPLFLAALLLLPFGARAEEGKAEPTPPPAPAAAPAAAPCPPQNPPPTPGLDVVLGAGYFEALHAGAAWHINENHTLGLFAGTNFGLPAANVNTLGLDWRYRIDRDLGGLSPALLVRTLYWTQRDDLYHWTLLSLVLGGSLTREVAPGTAVTLDAGAVRTFVVESDRQQDATFGNPAKWNATVCLSISHRLSSW